MLDPDPQTAQGWFHDIMVYGASILLALTALVTAIRSKRESKEAKEESRDAKEGSEVNRRRSDQQDLRMDRHDLKLNVHTQEIAVGKHMQFSRGVVFATKQGYLDEQGNLTLTRGPDVRRWFSHLATPTQEIRRRMGKIPDADLAWTLYGWHKEDIDMVCMEQGLANYECLAVLVALAREKMQGEPDSGILKRG